MKTKKKLAVEQAEQLAAQIVANAQAIVMSAQAAQPRRRLGLWEAVHDEVVLSVSKL